MYNCCHSFYYCFYFFFPLVVFASVVLPLLARKVPKFDGCVISILFEDLEAGFLNPSLDIDVVLLFDENNDENIFDR